MILISWNLRGLHAKVKRNLLKKLILKHKPVFSFIQETKVESFEPRFTKSFIKDESLKWCHSPSEGNSGGLLTIWDKTVFVIDSFQVNRNWTAIWGSIINQNFRSMLVNIYNPCNVSQRDEVWRETKDLSSSLNLPLLIAGDFNETLSEADRGSQFLDNMGALAFREFLQDMQLLEIPADNGRFTWFRGNSKSKLDRVFVQPEWITTYPSLKLTLLNRSVSDHCPLLISSQCQNWGPRPFRFIDAWLQHKGCLPVIRKAWINGGNMNIMDKLRSVKPDLKKWNTEEFGSIDDNIVKLENQIQHWDMIANNRTLE